MTCKKENMCVRFHKSPLTSVHFVSTCDIMISPIFHLLLLEAEIPQRTSPGVQEKVLDHTR